MAFSSGSGYDLATTTWSPEGRVFQVEYALKHIDSKGCLSLGLCCKDGVVLASQVELVHDTLKYPSPTMNAIHAVDDNIMVSFCGMRPDGLYLVERARSEAESWRDRYGCQISADTLANRMALFITQFTEYYGYRPLGASIFISSYVNNETSLFTVNPAGEVAGFFGSALGAEKQAAKTELEALIDNHTVDDAAYQLIKILKKCFDENTSKKIELQVGVVSEGSPKMSLLDHSLIKEMEQRADAELEDEDDEDDDDEDEEEDDN